MKMKHYSNLEKLQYYIDQIKVLTQRIEYILEGNLLEKSVKQAILLYFFHTAGVLHIFMLYNLLGPGISFIENLKLLLKENQIKKQAGFMIDQ